MYFIDFGTKLKKLRHEKHLTQTELGNLVGASKALISKYENDLSYPSYDILIKIAKYFGVTTDYLLGIEKHGRTLDVDDLNEAQINSLMAIIEEYRKRNK